MTCQSSPFWVLLVSVFRLVLWTRIVDFIPLRYYHIYLLASRNYASWMYSVPDLYEKQPCCHRSSAGEDGFASHFRLSGPSDAELDLSGQVNAARVTPGRDPCHAGLRGPFPFGRSKRSRRRICGSKEDCEASSCYLSFFW